MGGVHASEYVGFQSRVHGDYAETADNFRVVGNFGGAEHDFVVEEVEVGKQLCLNLVGECHGACAGQCALACAKQFKHGILYNFRVHHEVGEFLVETQVIEHCIGHVAHAALQGEEFFRDAAFAIFAHEETNHVGADAF